MGTLKKILILAANPKDRLRSRLDEEVREIENGLRLSQQREEFVVKQQWATRSQDIRRAMLNFCPNIVHFCGHGERETGIVFENETGLSHLVSAEALAEFFKLFAEHVKCVVLNACYSEVQAQAIARYIDYVIGISQTIGDRTAIEFAVVFYEALGAGKTIEFAYKLACNALHMMRIPEHLIPIILTKDVREPITLSNGRRSQNPFGLHGGVDPEQFVIPERLVREVTEAILKKLSISLIGARMMGKTSLLKFLSSDRCQSYYQDETGQRSPLRFVYLDLQEHSGKNLHQLFPLLANTMSVLLPDSERFQGKMHDEALSWIKQTTGRRDPTNPLWVVSFDEFDRVIELDGLDKIVFDQMRSLSQHSNICFIIASRLKLIDLPLPQAISTSPFFNIFKEQLLSVWDKLTTRTLMFKPYGKDLGVFTEEDFVFISQLTACHPALLQIGCFHLFNARRTCKDTPIDYEQVIENYINEAESVYHHYWNNEISEEERRWLLDCQWALFNQDHIALQALENNSIERKNRTIRIRLAKLGLALNTSGTIELPTGLLLFLKTVEIF